MQLLTLCVPLITGFDSLVSNVSTRLLETLPPLKEYYAAPYHPSVVDEIAPPSPRRPDAAAARHSPCDTI
jgi:hypothetical protein